MYFGQPVPESTRIPFRRPAEASYYTPRLPRTRFMSHINPFMNVLNPLAAFQAHLPRMDPLMQPGAVRVGPRARGVYQAEQQQQLQPTLPTPGPITGGFFGAGPMVDGRSGSPDPYRVMRTGAWPSIRAGGQNLRTGVVGAGNFIRSQTPNAFVANTPAGTYRVG
jgi:hypothetical protein